MKITDEQKKQALEEVEQKYAHQVSEKSICDAEIVAEKNYKDKSVLKPVWDKIQLMFEIAKHPKIWGSKVAIAAGAALLYLVSPIDVIPDVIPAAGLADDLAVILAVLNVVSAGVQKVVQKNPKLFLAMLPEKLRPVAVTCFKLDPVENDSDAFVTGYTDVTSGPAVRNAKLLVGLYGGAGKLYDRCAAYCDKAEKEGRTNKIGYKFRKRLISSFENKLADVADFAVVEDVQTELDLMAERKFTKDLVCLVCFALGIASFRFLESGIAFVYISAFFLACTYAFFAVGLVNGVRLVLKFLFKGIKLHRQYPAFTLTDCGVCAVVSDLYRINPEDTKAALDRSKENRRFSSMLLRVCYRLFNNSVLRLIFKLVLISFGLFVLKSISTGMHYNMSVGEMMIAPFKVIFGQR